MKVIIYTQVFENYAWREDGTIGKGPDAYWKAKGGDEYVIPNVYNVEQATKAVMALRERIEKANDYMMEFIIDYKLVADDFLTEFERSQLEYDGKIDYPAKKLIWA